MNWKSSISKHCFHFVQLISCAPVQLAISANLNVKASVDWSGTGSGVVILHICCKLLFVNIARSTQCTPRLQMSYNHNLYIYSSTTVNHHPIFLCCYWVACSSRSCPTHWGTLRLSRIFVEQDFLIITLLNKYQLFPNQYTFQQMPHTVFVSINIPAKWTVLLLTHGTKHLVSK